MPDQTTESFTELTVALSPKAWQAMKDTANRIGSTSTDAVNQGLLLVDAVTVAASVGLTTVSVPDLLGDGQEFVLTIQPAKPRTRAETEAALRERIGPDGLAFLERQRRIEAARDAVVDTARLWLATERGSDDHRERSSAAAARVDAVDRLMAEEATDA